MFCTVAGRNTASGCSVLLREETQRPDVLTSTVLRMIMVEKQSSYRTGVAQRVPGS